jgi:predicted GIY-YIG superfamily endonuclease
VNRTRRRGELGLSVLNAAADDAPRVPGVYFFLGADDEVLYVGKASNLSARLRQHAATKVSDYRLDDKYDLVRRVAWELAPSEEAAFWREEELIFALRPPYNADPDARNADPMKQDRRAAPYIVVAEAEPGLVRLELAATVLGSGSAYGCFPHLGKGKGAPLGIACSDGYTALLRLLWAASGAAGHVPARITRSAPAAFTVPIRGELRSALHRFLSGTRARLAAELLDAASHRPAYMQTALRRDKEAALRFYAAGPQLLRKHRLDHRIRSRTLAVETYRRLLVSEVDQVTGNPIA